MKNRERYGKGKSWTLRIHEDGTQVVHIEVDAYAWKDDLTVITTAFQTFDLHHLSRLLLELGEFYRAVAAGEVEPQYMVIDGEPVEPDDADWPF